MTAKKPSATKKKKSTVGRKPKLTAKQVGNALMKSAGIRSAAAELLKVAPNTIKAYIDKNPELVEVENLAKDVVLDLAESKLIGLINDSNLTAIIFYLKTKGKERGYIERHEHTGKDGKDLNATTAKERVQSRIDSIIDKGETEEIPERLN